MPRQGPTAPPPPLLAAPPTASARATSGSTAPTSPSSSPQPRERAQNPAPSSPSSTPEPSPSAPPSSPILPRSPSASSPPRPPSPAKPTSPTSAPASKPPSNSAASLAPEASTENTNALRLIFAEADNLPGIVLDRYHDLLILQLLTQGTAQQDVRTTLTEVLREAFPAATLIERPDLKIRDLENLPATSPEDLFGSSDQTTLFTLNQIRFHFDATSGQKTGAFLDQRLNYAAAARHASGEALDICTYQGGFALHLAQTCRTVTGVDSSRAALKVADRNLDLNPHLPAKIDWIEADAFDLLRDFESSGRHYDTIVLDPPAFAKSRRAAEQALRGYKELNLRAMKLLRPGGTLVTCSCSHHVPLPDFMEVLRTSAIDARRRVQLLETRGAAPDHPTLLTLPETNYLKCIILRID